ENQSIRSDRALASGTERKLRVKRFGCQRDIDPELFLLVVGIGHSRQMVPFDSCVHIYNVTN
ncbi:MAG: hypothetical protein AAFO04_30035, partial [Cyanobacteria bacterium J06592_8]